MSRMKRALLCSVIGVAGCDPAVTSDFRGEPLYTMRGAVTGEVGAGTPLLDVVVAWLGTSSFTNDPIAFEVDRIHVQNKTDVTGDFPAQFELRIFEPPPDGSLISAALLDGSDVDVFAEDAPAFAFGIVLVTDRLRPPNVRYDELQRAIDLTGPMPEGVFGISTATLYYTEHFALSSGVVLPPEIDQQEPGFLLVEPLPSAMGRAWRDFASLRTTASSYRVAWSACVEACVDTPTSWLDGEGCAAGAAIVDDGTITRAACLQCEVQCATSNAIESIEGYAVARGACEEACADEPDEPVCATACTALDPIMLTGFPGDAVVVGSDDLVTIELREPGE